MGNLLAWLIKVTISILLLVIIVTIVAQVFWRYVLQAPLIWPEEVSRYSFIWISFLGMTLLLRSGSLMVFEALLHAMPLWIQARMAVLIDLSMVPLLAIFVRQGIVMMRLVQDQVAPSLGVSMVWVYLSVPVSGALGLWFIFERLFTGSVSLPRDRQSLP